MFTEKYTTNEKIAEEIKVVEKAEDRTEDKKTIITNDAFAVGEVIEQSIFLMMGSIQASIRGMVK